MGVRHWTGQRSFKDRQLRQGGILSSEPSPYQTEVWLVRGAVSSLSGVPQSSDCIQVVAREIVLRVFDPISGVMFKASSTLPSVRYCTYKILVQ